LIIRLVILFSRKCCPFKSGMKYFLLNLFLRQLIAFAFVYLAMCHHMPKMGLLVCFACLALSTSTMEDQFIDNSISCHTKDLYDKYSSDGSLSLQGLDQILKTVRENCSSIWKEKEKDVMKSEIPSQKISDQRDPISEVTDSDPNSVPFSSKGKETFPKNSNFCISFMIIVTIRVCFSLNSLVICWSECTIHLWLWSGSCSCNKNPTTMAFPTCYPISSRLGCGNINGRRNPPFDSTRKKIRVAIVEAIILYEVLMSCFSNVAGTRRGPTSASKQFICWRKIKHLQS
jgi:hypothetical protein